MPSSVLLDLPGPVALVCHDAGSANHVFAWMQADVLTQPEGARSWRLLVKGPAELLWAQQDLSQVALCKTIDEVLDGASVLLSGTGWASDLEFKTIQAARLQGIRSIAVVDHWVNYHDRFERDGIVALPDDIWVTDEYARKLAETLFEDIRVIQKPNRYLEKIVQEIQSYESSNEISNDVLYVLEPIREAWGEGVSNGEFLALDFLVQNMGSLGLRGDPSIRLRPHPSDPVGKYDQWIKRQGHLTISIDGTLSLPESIARANVVVGCQTYAMVIALAAGKQVYSSIPSWAPSCILPQEGIIKISELAQQKSIGC